MKNKYLIYISIILLFLLNSCSPVGVIATTTSAGAVVAESDRSVGEAVDDISIKIKITEKFVKSPLGIFFDIDTTVKLGTVLLTGIVEHQEARIEAVKLVWEIEGVREVINEVQVGNKQGIIDYTKDLWISTQVRAKTLNELGLDVVTYNFETINGKVHFMGVAKDAEEVKKIIKIIRSVKGVREIANHIIVRD